MKFGTLNPALTQAIRRLARRSEVVSFTVHAEMEMDDDGFDHEDVLLALRRGEAYGPETQKNQLRANVVHRGLKIRVVVGGIDNVGEDWERLQSVRVITVMGHE